MSRCRTADFFYALIPLNRWRSWLIRRHVEGCAHCQSRLVSRAESRSLFVQEETEGIERAIWAAVETELTAKARTQKRTTDGRSTGIFHPQRWAVAAALLLVLATGYWILRDFRPEAVSVGSAASARFELAYARVDGKPASVVIYQPQGSDMIIVWAGKN